MGKTISLGFFRLDTLNSILLFYFGIIKLDSKIGSILCHVYNVVMWCGLTKHCISLPTECNAGTGCVLYPVYCVLCTVYCVLCDYTIS